MSLRFVGGALRVTGARRAVFEIDTPTLPPPPAKPVEVPTVAPEPVVAEVPTVVPEPVEVVEIPTAVPEPPAVAPSEVETPAEVAETAPEAGLVPEDPPAE